MIEKQKLTSRLYRELVCFYYEKKTDLLVAFFVGIIAHLIKFVNYYPTADSMYAIDSGFLGMTGFGRWLSGIATVALSSTYDLQWVEGMVAIFFCALTILLILDICEIEIQSHRYLAIILFMVFPTMASTFCYINWAPAYMCSFFLAIVSVSIIIKAENRRAVMLAALLICLSFGIYQIYVTTAAVCFLYYCICQLIRDAVDKKRLQTKCLNYFLSVAIGAVIYIIMVKIALLVTDSSLRDYQGISEAGNMSIADMLGAFVRMVYTAGSFYLGKVKVSLYAMLSILFLGLAVFIWLRYVVLNECYERSNRIAVMVCLCGTFLVTYIYLFVSATTVYHMVMQVGNYFVFLGILMLLEHNKDVHNSLRKVVLCLIAVMCFYHFINNNIAYKQMEMSYEKTYFETTRILTMIDGLNKNDINEILMIGKESQNEEVVDAIPNITGASSNSFLCSTYQLVQFVNYYFDRSYVAAEDFKAEEIVRSKEYQKMDVYPKGKCVGIIDDIIVIKMNNDVSSQ